MLGAIRAGLKLLSGGVDLLLGRQRRKEREAHESAGAARQRQGSAEAQLEQGRQGHEIDEAVAGMSDDELDAELRRNRRSGAGDG